MSRRVSWAGFFFQGGAPPPLTGGATAPHFSFFFVFAKSTYFLVEDTLLIVLSEKKSKVGVQFFQGRGKPPFHVSSFRLNRLGLCKCIMIKIYIF